MNIRQTLARMASTLDDVEFYAEANALDGVLKRLSSKITVSHISPEEVLTLPNAKQIIHEARNWALDNQWLDEDEIEDYDDYTILRGVDSHYAGGIEQLIRDSIPDSPHGFDPTSITDPVTQDSNAFNPLVENGDLYEENILR